MKRIFLIDGTAIVFRSFHAFARSAPLTAHGQDVGMIYGFLLSLLMILRREKPDSLAITFDTGAPTFRHKMYDKYKANRPPIDPNLVAQLPLLYEIVGLLRIPCLMKEGWEADDLMGTLAVQGEKAGHEMFLVTGDKDFYQLVSDKVKVYTLPTKKEPNPRIFDPKGVEEKFGVHPELITDALALMGDASDNVPGVPKVGQKTAVKLLKEYGDMEAVLKAAPQIKQPKLRENLIEFADQARFSKELVIIDKDSPVGVGPDELEYGPVNNPEIRSKLADLDFGSIIRQLDEIDPSGADLAEEISVGGDEGHSYVTVTTQGQLREMIDELRSAELISVDTETTSLDSMRAELVGLSFSIEEKQGWYVSVNHFEKMPDSYVPPKRSILRPDAPPEVAYILNRLKPIFADADLHKTGQNLKYDIHILNCYDVDVRGVVFDTMIASHILDPSARQHNLDILAERHLGITKIPTSRLIGSGSKQISMADVDLEDISIYACEDTDVALRLTNLFKSDIEEKGFAPIFNKQELPLLDVLVAMEGQGVMLDTALLKEMSVTFQAEIEVLETEVYDLAGERFNMNSTQQLSEILFNRLGLPVGRKTKFGYSTDINELERLAPIHELPDKLLRYRHLTKLKSTYIDALPKLIHPITGRVHTSYSQTVAATGRLSSNDPNLQNIPIRSDDGGRIRKAFIAGYPGWKIIAADYSQVELRVMAHLSGDEHLLQAFRDGLDIHSSTAAWMHDMPLELVTPDMRRQAKEVNFGVLYGMGAFGLAQRLGISRKRASDFIDQYFTRFARVKEYVEEIKATTRTNGYVETMMGRKRPLPEINAHSARVRQNAERIAINTPIQGSAADLMKIAMINVYNMLENEGFKTRMLMQVHDELVFEAPEDEVEAVSKRIIEEMAGAMELKVPLDVDISAGENWLDAHE